MIRSDDGGEGWLLIRQPEHARLAGDLARAWGEPPFRPPEPFAETVLAIAHHDDGWADWEAAPRADLETGRPLSFLEVGAAEHVEIWRRSTALAHERDRYAALLVSRHAVDLLRYRLSAPGTQAEDRAAIEAFFAEQTSLRAAILAEARGLEAGPAGIVRWHRPAWGRLAEDATVEAGFRLLQALDYLSLVLCGAFPPGRIEAVPGRDGPEAHALDVAGRGPSGAALRPWPFTIGPPLRVEIQVQRLPAARHDDLSLKEALGRAPVERMALTLEAAP